MKRKKLKDNRYFINPTEVRVAIPKLYDKLVGKTLQYFENNDDFFVFTDQFSNAEDFTEKDKEEACILRLDDSEEYLQTSNVMGFFGCEDERLTITSRFANGNKDFFLQYLLKKVLDFPNIVNMMTDTDPSGQLFDWTVILFQKYLKDAMRKGLYKQYVIRHYNDENLRGTLDIPRHIAKNTPFLGKVAYNCREFSYDNGITHLIRHAIEYIRNRERGDLLLSRVKDEIDTVVKATPDYRLGDRRRVIEANARNPIVNAYYSEYRSLQRLCLMILCHQMHRYGSGSGRMYGILFDGAWLWEEYLNTLIGDRFRHPRNKDWMGGQILFATEDKANIKWVFPDFMSKEEPRIIADAKYKPMKNIGKRNGDYYQMLSYMFRFDAKQGYFLYPESTDGDSHHRYFLYRGLDDAASKREDVSFVKLGLVVPDEAGSYDDFAEAMHRSEQAFLDVLYREG